jgi:lysophospholipase L1-like esterase
MKVFTVFLSLCLLLACKKGAISMDNEKLPADTLASVVDTTKKPVDPIKKLMDTTKKPVDPNQGKQINYLALGDSYTIGESVERIQIFPAQLVKQLEKAGLIINPPTIIARTGWTTSELQAAIKESGVIQKFNFVTLLIGVNNQYRGESKDQYRKEFKELLQTAVNYVDGNKAHVFVLSIPDWGVTPFGKQSGRDQEMISREIDAFNAINKEESLSFGISYTDITPASRNAAADHSLVASDGLHPSGKMYEDWAVNTAAAVIKALK